MRIGFRFLWSLAVLTMATGASAQPVESIKVMSFNVWVAEGTESGRDKLVEIIQAADADIVGLQEMGNSAGQSVAASLGFHYHQQSGGDIQILSRFPIIGQSPSNLGAQIELSPGQEVWLFNSHLSAFPYQPYDLRDGELADEAEAIAAANSTRGGQVSSYLNDMAGAFASGDPVFFTGDFNEPSHLDWTQAAADATSRPFDLKVDWPASKQVVDAGMTDSFRAVRPDEVNDTAYTWTPGAPPPNVSSNEVHDRIDFVYHDGEGVFATSASTLGIDAGNPNTDISIAGYNADHRAVVVTFDVPAGILLGDFDGNGFLDAADWNQFRTGQHADLSGLTQQQAYQMGDLNEDFQNNHTDFVLFKSAFESSNGAGSFGTMVASVPEPTSLVILVVGALVMLNRLRSHPVIDR